MKWLWRSGLMRCGRVVFFSYLGVCVVLWLMENTMVFRPAPAQDWCQPPSAADVQDVELHSADDTRLHAWWLPCPGAKLAVLYCHGNAGNLSHRGDAIVQFREQLKAHVLIFDYPGYGKSEGRPNEEGCYRAADAAYAFLTRAQQISPENIVIYGGSLGGGVAVDLASRQRHRALVLAKTFTSAPDAGATMFPWLPVRWLMRNRFDNLAKIKSCTRPVFIAHGAADRLIPFAMGQALFEAANEPKQFLTLDDAGHNDPLPLEFFTKLRSFLAEHP